jgi:N-6 DNA Methylase/TaqI-like C-terminal specificity domain
MRPGFTLWLEMDLFAAAGIDIGDGGRGGRAKRGAIGRTLRVPLLKHKVVADALKGFTFDLSPQEVEAAANYARTVKSPKFAKIKETSARPLFIEEVLQKFLGYKKLHPDGPHTLAHEEQAGTGSVDVALGHFATTDGRDNVIAPFELKGPTTDLDAIMPRRGLSPVQQAWNYAIDLPGCRWVLVSNCMEIRLYGFGRGREAYELFDLSKLDEPYERERLWLLLSAGRLLDGGTDALLRETDSAYKTITNDLYQQYSALRQNLVQFLTGSADGPKLALAAAIEPAQKILDRILFIAFAERTALLPDRLLKRAVERKNEFRPEPIWNNFLSLFDGVNEGSDSLDIWPYNGGLFARDPAVDDLSLPDHLAKALAALGEWDYRDDVPVTLLGHLFEQSITDLEKLRAESRGEEAPKVSKRKREGVVYTPDIVTRFLVERTIGLTLSERFKALLAKHGKELPDNGDPIFAENERGIERAFWRDYSEALRALRIVDPACGSGAFLVAAFDLLAAEYHRVVEHLAVLGEKIDFDPFDEIVTRNLYGVDLNAESVEITRLALWLKTARYQHRLQNLEATIKVGNSLIDDPKFTEHPFDWRAAFADVFAKTPEGSPGGFDIVIGNPPYVRMELIKPVKPYLEKKYVVADDRTDLYAYFFERGVGVLKDGGRLGYISSSTFFRTGSGENLRKFLGDHVAVEAVVDFGDLQIFEGVTTYPAIVTLRKGAAEDGGALAFLKVDELPKDLEAEFVAKSQAMPRARLGAGAWQLENDALARLRDKIVKGKKTLGEVYGAPLYGIKTGLNEAFIVDRETRDRLVKQDKKSAKLLRQFLRGEDVKRWTPIYADKWLICIPAGWSRQNLGKGKGKSSTETDYWNKLDSFVPAIAGHLARFASKARIRSDKGDFWWELRPCSYYDAFSVDKIVYPYLMKRSSFTIETTKALTSKTTYFLRSNSYAALAYLNSTLAWFLIAGDTPPKAGGYREIMTQYLEHLALPNLGSVGGKQLAKLGEESSAAARKLSSIKSTVRHRILDLAPPERAKLSRKLEEWWTLDFAAFRDEVKRVFRSEIQVKERGEWENYLAKHAAEVCKLNAEIEKAEREIDAIVYRLFDLTPEEVALLEASIAGPGTKNTGGEACAGPG